MQPDINTTIQPMLLYPKDVMKLIGVKTTAFHAMAKAPGFPQPKYPTGSTRPMYLRAEIEDWVKSL